MGILLERGALVECGHSEWIDRYEWYWIGYVDIDFLVRKIEYN